MKKIIILLFVIFSFQSFTFSQIDLKTGFHASLPFGLFFSGEYPLFDDIGVEIGMVANPGIQLDQTHFSGAAFLMNIRYYFSPRTGIDRWFASFYVRPNISVLREEFLNFGFSPGFPFGVTTSTISIQNHRDSGVGVGIMVGKKWVKKDKYFFEFDIGAGKNIGRRVSDIEVLTFRNGRVNIDLFYNLVVGLRLK